jgi:NRPS condensation-like uncharacterized protein
MIWLKLENNNIRSIVPQATTLPRAQFYSKMTVYYRGLTKFTVNDTLLSSIKICQAVWILTDECSSF